VVTYQEFGANYYDQQNKDRLTRHLVKRLESLGNVVTVKPTDRAA
jgi:hypothetical protein